MAVERSELKLVWPPTLFVREAEALLTAGASSEGTLGWLLAEAFHGDRGFRLFQEVSRSSTHEALDDLFGVAPSGSEPPESGVTLVADLAHTAETIPRYRPRTYYSRRLRPSAAAARLTPSEITSAWAQEVVRLADSGYFDGAFGSSCGDDRDDPYREGQEQLSALLGATVPLWPLALNGQPTNLEQGWPEELFYDVVEALHDLVARPRRRDWHDYGRHWDYDDFSITAGQAVYRWRTNELLDRSVAPLRLAESGSDVGLLVHAVGDPRDDLVDRAVATPAVGDRAEVEHAIGLFRSRSGTRDDKRSAAVALARVLENRRSLIKAEFLSGDERALFEIANTFDLRHRKANQRPNYDDAYLDWIFWCYLAAVELTDRLLTRQAAAGA